MNKKAQVTIWVIIGILLVGAFIIAFVFISSEEVESEIECVSDEDCVPATCCHASSCAAVGSEQDCSGVACTLECAPGTLDCGQGNCLCVNGKCAAVIEQIFLIEIKEKSEEKEIIQDRDMMSQIIESEKNIKKEKIKKFEEHR